MSCRAAGTGNRKQGHFVKEKPAAIAALAREPAPRASLPARFKKKLGGPDISLERHATRNKKILAASEQGRSLAASDHVITCLDTR